MYNESFGSAMKRSFMNWPVALRTIIAVNVFIFIIQAVGGTVLDNYIIQYFALITDFHSGLLQPWRLISYMFLHASVWHILFNMLWLWWMGRPVEETLGSRVFLVIYFGSGIGGALINIMLSPLIGSSIVIGASGAVFGIMVAFAVLYPRMPIMLLFLPPIEARYVVGGLIALEVLFMGSGGHVARMVHLGGALCGYLLMKTYYKGYDFNRLFSAFDNFMAKERDKTPKRNVNMHAVDDAEIIEEKDQSELDRILDKISKTGYEGLTDDEKRILFELSKRS